MMPDPTTVCCMEKEGKTLYRQRITNLFWSRSVDELRVDDLESFELALHLEGANAMAEEVGNVLRLDVVAEFVFVPLDLGVLDQATLNVNDAVGIDRVLGGQDRMSDNALQVRAGQTGRVQHFELHRVFAVFDRKVELDRFAVCSNKRQNHSVLPMVDMTESFSYSWDQKIKN